MPNRYVCLFAIGVILAPAPARADQIDDFIQAEMQNRGIPGLALAVLNHGRVIKSAGFGIANLEAGSRVTPHSVFDLASLTKPFTATAVMILVEEGKLDIDQSVRKYVRGLPEAWEKMTVAHLLAHTSGLPELFPEEEQGPPSMEVSAASQFESLIHMRLLDRPGMQGNYSDPGYFLLGLVIEKVSGKPYGQFLAERIFTSLGMTSSSLIDHWKIVKDRVSSYIRPRQELLNARRDFQVELPSYFGIRSTAEDLEKWEQALDSATILKRETLTKMWTPWKLADGSQSSVGGRPYGLGWMLDQVDGHPIAEHSGVTGTDMLRSLDTGVTVIVLTNLGVARSQPGVIARGVLARLPTSK